MDRMIYLTMTGAKAAMQRQEVISHNLANVSTTGFREQLAAFRPCRCAATAPPPASMRWRRPWATTTPRAPSPPPGATWMWR
jgi:flagellar basal body rod protein FlgF